MHSLRPLVLYGCLLLAACGSDEQPTTPPAGSPEGATAPGPEDATALAPGPALPPRGPARFLARRELEVPGKPSGLLVDDLDGDGAPELICALAQPARLLIWRGGPNGIGRQPLALDCGGYGLPPVSMPAADGGRVLVLASRSEDALDLWSGRALASSTAATRIELGARPRALAAGDLLADGTPELAIACDGGELLIARNGRIVQRVALPLARPTCAHILRAGEGVVVGGQLEQALVVWSAEDLLAGAQPTRIVQLPGIPRDLAELDLDGDGDHELVVAGGDRELWVLGLGAPGGAAAWAGPNGGAPETLEAPGLIPLDLEVMDLNGDGSEELLSVQYLDSSYGVVAPAPATGEAFSTSEAAGQTPIDCAVGDLDGDGLPDLAVANRDALRVSVLSGTGLVASHQQCFYQAKRVAIGAHPRAVTAADLNGDGYPEAVAINAADETVSILDSDFGLLEARRAPFHVGRGPDAPVLCELDGDGHLDLALLCQFDEQSRLVLRLGDGSGGLRELAQAPELVVGVGARDLLALDLDQDGLDELVVCDEDGGALLMLANLGGAPGSVNFAAPQILPLSPAPKAMCVWRESVPGSGAVVAVAQSDGQSPARVRLLHLMGDAPGAPRERPWEGALLEPAGALGEALDIASGDVDGDGTTDLVLLVGGQRGSMDGWLYAFRNLQHGWQGEAPRPTGKQPAALAVGDVDGDGLADLFCAAQNSHNLGYWRSRIGPGGALSFERQHDLGCGYGPLDVQLFDLDMDGDLDLLSANTFNRDLSVIYNVPRR